MTTVKLDPETTLACVAGSAAAYEDFEGKSFKAPPNFQYVNRCTGWNSLGEERFALVFRGLLASNATTYMVAFRGTNSLGDILDDAGAITTNFAPYRNAVSPTPAVHSGFYAVYARPPTPGGKPLRQQVFELLPPTATRVLVTGHSLGAALAHLFTLDVRISLPALAVQCINLASPRVGTATWATACARTGADAAITRVINYWDYVPVVPPLDTGYVSVGAEFQTAFSGPWWDSPIDELPRHSLENLTTVLSHCVWLTPQVWRGSFLDAYWKYYNMVSTAPPATSRDEVLAKFEEWKRAEAALLVSSQAP